MDPLRRPADSSPAVASEPPNDAPEDPDQPSPTPLWLCFPASVIDPKLRRHPWRYVVQCLLATLTLLLILSMEDALSRAVVIGAIGSTAFVLFIMPRSITATRRHVVGGHLIALIVGSLASLPAAELGMLFALEGAAAVGVSLFLMAATNTEHPPAAGRPWALSPTASAGT